MSERDYTIEAVAQAMVVLRKVADSRGPMAVPTIMEACGISKDKAFRLVQTLVAANWLEPVGEGYQIGMAAALVWARKKSQLGAAQARVAGQIKELGGSDGEES